jgi:hypothetical protein
MIARIRRPIPLALGLIALASIPSTVRAQGNVFNPYGNSGYADYREFGTPMISNNPALPGQALLNGEPLITRPRANSFQQYTDELNGVQSDPRSTRGRAAPGESYYQAYQRLNTQYNRVYRPNDTPENRKFEERQKQRDDLYAKAMEERDPVKRAQILRQIQREPVARPAAPTRSRAATGSTGTPSNRVTPAPAPISRAPSPFTSPAPSASGERRAPAPSPFSTARPPSTSSPATRRPPSPYRALSPDSAAPRPDPAAQPYRSSVDDDDEMIPSRPGSTSRPAPSTRSAPDPSSIPIPPPQ